MDVEVAQKNAAYLAQMTNVGHSLTHINWRGPHKWQFIKFTNRTEPYRAGNRNPNAFAERRHFIKIKLNAQVN